MDLKKLPIKKLRKICQPNLSDPNTNWRDKIYYSLSIYITKPILHTSITANQVSLFMIFLGLLSVIFFMEGSYKFLLIGLLIYHLSMFLDWVDGEVARCKKQGSLKGAYYDYIYHSVVTPLIIISLAINVYMNNPLDIPNRIFLIAGFIGVYSFMLNWHLRLFEATLGKKVHEKKVKKSFKEEILYLFKFDWPFNFVFFFGIFNIIHYAVLIYALFSFLMLLSRIYLQLKKFSKR